MNSIGKLIVVLVIVTLVVTIAADETTLDGIAPEVTEDPYAERGSVPAALSDKYIVTLIKLNWYAAYAYCEQNNWRLLRIESAKKQFEVEKYLHFFNLQGIDFWIGGNNFENLRNFRWNYDGPSFTHTNWAFGEPNSFKGGEQCVKMFNNSLKWGDENCFKSYNFICEQE